MAKTNVKTKFQIQEFLNDLLSPASKHEIGKRVVTQCKQMIASGQSPVRGHGRFDGYSDSYQEQIKDGDLDNKTVRPVNLKQTGRMLYQFTYDLREQGIAVGFVDADPEVVAIARKHQKGEGRMPARRMIPEGQEEWAVSVMQIIKKVYSERLNAIIKRSNK